MHRRLLIEPTKARLLIGAIFTLIIALIITLATLSPAYAQDATCDQYLLSCPDDGDVPQTTDEEPAEAPVDGPDDEPTEEVTTPVTTPEDEETSNPGNDTEPQIPSTDEPEQGTTSGTTSEQPPIPEDEQDPGVSDDTGQESTTPDPAPAPPAEDPANTLYELPEEFDDVKLSSERYPQTRYTRSFDTPVDDCQTEAFMRPGALDEYCNLDPNHPRLKPHKNRLNCMIYHDTKYGDVRGCWAWKRSSDGSWEPNTKKTWLFDDEGNYIATVDATPPMYRPFESKPCGPGDCGVEIANDDFSCYRVTWDRGELYNDRYDSEIICQRPDALEYFMGEKPQERNKVCERVYDARKKFQKTASHCAPSGGGDKHVFFHFGPDADEATQTPIGRPNSDPTDAPNDTQVQPAADIAGEVEDSSQDSDPKDSSTASSIEDTGTVIVLRPAPFLASATDFIQTQISSLDSLSGALPPEAVNIYPGNLNSELASNTDIPDTDLSTGSSPLGESAISIPETETALLESFAEQEGPGTAVDAQTEDRGLLGIVPIALGIALTGAGVVFVRKRLI